jgi:K+-sensing histidine kinase KdpD
MVEVVRERLFAVRWRIPARLAAMAVPLATCAILSTVRDHINAAPSVLLLLLWVIGVAATGDRVAVLLAAVSGVAWFDFLLAPPYHRFTIIGSDGVETTFVLAAMICLAVTEIALWGYRQQARAARHSGYLDDVVCAASLVSEGEMPASALVEVVAHQIADVLGVDGCRYVETPVFDARVAILDHSGDINRAGHAVDVDRVGIPSNEYVAIPVRWGTRMVGHFLVISTSQVAYPSREQRRVAALLAAQVAVAVEIG